MNGKRKPNVMAKKEKQMGKREKINIFSDTNFEQKALRNSLDKN